MRKDLDHLMLERDLAAIIVTAGEHYSPQFDYLTRGVVMTHGFAVKKPGSDPILVAKEMEIEEAGATGLQAVPIHQLGLAEILEATQGDQLRADAEIWARALNMIEVSSGRIGVYGLAELNHTLAFTQVLSDVLNQYEFVGESKNTIFDVAYETKDEDEIRRIRSVATRTNTVVRATRDFLSSHRADADETLRQADGTPLTIGDVKRFVRTRLIELDLEESNMIFAQGREGGYPHSRGTESVAIKMGEAIVFDLFPREVNGGYYHDMTRTWCIGYAPDEVREAYNQVMKAFNIAVNDTGLGLTSRAQQAVQSYFEDLGHATLRTGAGTQEGYIHSLGHGLGLNVHENPYMRHTSTYEFKEGNVITIEPGLYYPSKGFGVRIEDTILIEKGGRLVTLTDVPKDLIVPLRG